MALPCSISRRRIARKAWHGAASVRIVFAAPPSLFWLEVVSTKNNQSQPWTATHSDLLADDWTTLTEAYP